MKEKEKLFIKELLKNNPKPYEAGIAMDYSDDKQFMYYLEKWTRKGWWDYGVSLRSGWFTPEGVDHFKKLLGE